MLVLTRWKKSSSVLNRSATVGTSSAQYPSHLPRHSSESRRARLAAEHIPDHAGAACCMRETTVARNMSCSDAVGVPCARSTRMAYIRLELDNSSVITWSAAVSLSFVMTPRLAVWIRARRPDAAAVALAVDLQ